MNSAGRLDTVVSIMPRLQTGELEELRDFSISKHPDWIWDIPAQQVLRKMDRIVRLNISVPLVAR
jgi:hypothetical protein